MFGADSPTIFIITSGTASEETLESDLRRVSEQAEVAGLCGVDFLQIREKALSIRSLSRLVDAAIASAGGSGLKILVNDRADVAATSGAAGVHLTSASMKPDALRRGFIDDFIIGSSAHDDDDVQEAQKLGADYVFFSPIFETPSKTGLLAPKGVTALRDSVERFTGFPIIALGGINERNFRSVLEAGAAGIAAIRMFSDLERIPAIVTEIKEFQGK